MNRKIILSFGVLVFVAAVAMTATGAFFSDTETSTGNTFTAGALDLKVDSQSHFNGLVCVKDGDNWEWHHPTDDASVPVGHYPQPGMPCGGTWSEADLLPGPEFRFFNFDDLKPGDEGENTISLHVYDNDAWGCMLVNNVSDLDVTCTEPETESTDPQCSVELAVPGAGELGAVLTFDAWLDEGSKPGFQCNDPDPDNNPETNDATTGASCVADPLEGDNILNGVEQLFWNDETVDEASEGPFPMSDVLGGAYTVHGCAEDFNATGHNDYGECHGLAQDGRMVGSTTYYWGLAWNVPESAGNEIQTDSLVLDMNFEVEQHRNNPNFSCTPPTQPTTGTITVDKIVTFTQQSVVGVDVNDFTLNLSGPSGDIVVTDNVASGPLLPGTYTVSEVYSNVPEGIQFNGSFSGSCTEVGDTGEGTVELAAGQNLVCTLTNLVTTPI